MNMEFIGKMEEDSKLLQENQIIIYGAGNIGKRLAEGLCQKGCRKKIVAFCDGNQELWGKEENGIKVLPLEEATERYPDAAYLIGSCCVRQIAETLIKAGIRKIHIVRNQESVMKKDMVIFGAGKFGKLALNKYRDRVAYFIDNNEAVWGNFIDGKRVNPLNYYLENDVDKYEIMIACKSQESIKRQLAECGIKEYKCYLETSQSYNPTEELIYNPYINELNRDITEDEANRLAQNSFKAKEISEEIELMKDNLPLFSHVEIETVNRCNGGCDFCPVSVKNERREYCEMTDALFEKIITELSEIDYRGKLALFSNNEPLLDAKIVERHKIARERVPNARMHLFTNGTLLALDKFVELVQYLDELIIDNYQQDLKLIPPCERIAQYCESHPQLKKKVTIVLRKPKEILSSRGGDAPNRKKMISLENVQCILPFKQMIIRPDGKVSLCCNDPYGKNTLGDVSRDTLVNVWNNQKYNMIRKCLYKGRKEWEHCKLCDFLSLG